MLKYITPLYALTKSEIRSYFVTPTTYIFLIIFLLLHAFLTLRLGGFFQAGEATMQGAFSWHIWLYLILIPAIGMHLWADERRDKTLELLLTFPITVTQAIIGKYLSALTIVALALICTLPMIGTIVYLGSPDWGPIISGYVGSFLVAATLLALSCFTSSLTRSHVSSFILSFMGAFLLNFIGWEPFVQFMRRLDMPTRVVDIIAAFSTAAHFEPMTQGIISLSDLVYFVSVILFFLLLNRLVILNNRNL